MTELDAPNSHLYPGARLSCRGALRDGPVTVLFADGSVTGGRLADDRLETRPYATAAGTAIPAKAWRLKIAGRDIRILAKAAPAD